MLAAKVTSFNVLSSSLARPDYYTSSKPEWLHPNHRLKTLKKKLSSEIDSNAIICLQEISQKWAGNLHSFFSLHGYYLVTGLYGSKFNGYMGVGIAIPMNVYDIVDVDITRIADTKRWPRNPKSSPLVQWIQDKIVRNVLWWIKSIRATLGFPGPSNSWTDACYRMNQMVSVRLKPKAEPEAKSFVVGTYHMPCMFKLPAVMMIHTALSAQHIHSYAKDDPYVFAGDFNIKPGSSMYRLLTEGDVESSNPDLPVMENGDDWSVAVSPLKSAYKESLGREPEFTNWAQVKDEEPFIDTLDYIFLSKHWAVQSVDAIPSKGELNGPLPVEHEPSDHVLISATISTK